MSFGSIETQKREGISKVLGRTYYEDDVRSEKKDKDGWRDNLILGKNLGGLVKS